LNEKYSIREYERVMKAYLGETVQLKKIERGTRGLKCDWEWQGRK